MSRAIVVSVFAIIVGSAAGVVLEVLSEVGAEAPKPPARAVAQPRSNSREAEFYNFAAGQSRGTHDYTGYRYKACAYGYIAVRMGGYGRNRIDRYCEGVSARDRVLLEDVARECVDSRGARCMVTWYD